MPTVAEMQILNRSMSDLGDTFQRNRALTAQEKERQAQQRLNEEMMGLRKREHEDTMGLRREELTAQTADRSDARENRKLALESQMAHQKKIEQYQAQLAAAKDEEGKWRVLESMGKEGMLTEDGIEQMNQAFSEKLGKVGIGVKMFKLPTPTDNKPQTWTDPNTGAPFVYNPRTGNFEKSEGTVTMTEEAGEDGEAPKRKISRKMSPADLEKAMAAAAAAKAAAGNGDPLEEAMQEGRNAPFKKEMDAHLKAIKEGDSDYGLLNMKDRPERVRELQQKIGAVPAGGRVPRITELQGPNSAGAGSSGGAEATFETEAAARAAGKKAGDVVRLMLNGKATRVRLK